MRWRRGGEVLIKSPFEFLASPMAQDEEEFSANTEVFKGNPDEVLRHWARKSDDSDLTSASPKIQNKDLAADGERS